MARTTAVVLVLLLCLTFPGYAKEAQDTEMYFTVAEWAYEVRGEGDYDPNPEGVFPKSQRAYAYLELAGFTTEQDGEYQKLKINVDVALWTPVGIRLFFSPDLLEFDSLYREPPETVWFYIYVDIPWWAPRGEYQTQVIVRDGIAETVLDEKRDILIR